MRRSCRGTRKDFTRGTRGSTRGGTLAPKEAPKEVPNVALKEVPKDVPKIKMAMSHFLFLVPLLPAVIPGTKMVFILP